MSLDPSTPHYFDKFAKSIARDKTRLWPALVETFAGHLDESAAKHPDQGKLLMQVAAKYPDLKAILEARSAQQIQPEPAHNPPAPA